MKKKIIHKCWGICKGSKRLGFKVKTFDPDKATASTAQRVYDDLIAQRTKMIRRALQRYNAGDHFSIEELQSFKDRLDSIDFKIDELLARFPEARR